MYTRRPRVRAGGLLSALTNVRPDAFRRDVRHRALSPSNTGADTNAAAVHQSRAQLARVQFAGAARGIRRAQSAAGATEVRRDLQYEPRRVLYGARRGTAPAARRERDGHCARRALAAGTARRDLLTRARASRTAAAPRARAAPPRARRSRRAPRTAGGAHGGRVGAPR